MIYYLIISLLLYLIYIYIQRINKNKKYNYKIENIFEKLKNYKKYNKKNYKLATKDWNRFINIINKLNNNDILFYNRDFETAEINFNNSINHYLSITLSIDNKKEMDELSFIINQLYKEGYNLLYNLSNKLNKKWKENTNINNKEIILDLSMNDKNQFFNIY